MGGNKKKNAKAQLAKSIERLSKAKPNFALFQDKLYPKPVLKTPTLAEKLE